MFVFLQCALDTSYWTGFNHFVVWGSIIYYFFFHLAFYSDPIRYKYSGVAFEVFAMPSFWLCLLLTSTLLIVPVAAYRFYATNFTPTLSDRVRLRQRIKKSKSKFGGALRIQRQSTMRRSNRSMRSGYAFAHQTGFGELITSGLNFRNKEHPAVLTKFIRGFGDAWASSGQTQRPSSSSLNKSATPLAENSGNTRDELLKINSTDKKTGEAVRNDYDVNNSHDDELEQL